MRHLLHLLVAVSRAVVLAAFAVIVVAVVVQIVSRTFLPHSPVWTEELTRFALLYLAAAGAGLALRTGDLVNVDIAVAGLSPGGRRAVRIVACLASLLLAATMFGPSFDFTAIGSFQTSPALGWPMNLVHVVTTIAAGSLGLFALAEIAELLLAPPAEGPGEAGEP